MISKIAIAPILIGDETEYEFELYDECDRLIETFTTDKFETYYNNGQLFCNVSIPTEEVLLFNQI